MTVMILPPRGRVDGLTRGLVWESMAKRRAAQAAGIHPSTLEDIRIDLRNAQRAKSCHDRVWNAEGALEHVREALATVRAEAPKKAGVKMTPDMRRLLNLRDKAARLIASCAGREAPAAKRKR